MSNWISMRRIVENTIARLEAELEPKSRPQEHFPPLEDLVWKEVSITFIDDWTVQIRARDATKRYNYTQMGFVNKRSGLPDTRWGYLQVFAQNSGEISWETEEMDLKDRKALPHAVTDIRKRLRELIGIEDDPFYDYKTAKAYKTKFEISDQSFVKASP
jgi:hypothetical protein